MFLFEKYCFRLPEMTCHPTALPLPMEREDWGEGSSPNKPSLQLSPIGRESQIVGYSKYSA
ncbi:hypothetical protein [Alysiella filiformis]|nr:hypothetical protein [Alysiella filiformis]